MKQFITLLTVSFFTWTPAFSQRQIDLQLTLTDPQDSVNILSAQNFPITVSIKNAGTENLALTDTINYYIILWGDTLLFFPQNENHFAYTGYQLSPGDSVEITRYMAFDASFEGTTTDFCVYVKPVNAANPAEDPDLMNNQDCVTIHVVDDVTGIAEKEKGSLIVFPNPSIDHFTVLKSDGPIQGIYLSDPLGKRFKPVMLDDNTIDCSGLDPGIYYLVVDGIVKQVMVL
jgi:hypothetical protein